MQTNNKILELVKFLPHGYRKEIIKRSGVSHATVRKFFDGKKVRYVKAKAIIIETLKFYKEVKDLETSVMKEMMGTNN